MARLCSVFASGPGHHHATHPRNSSASGTSSASSKQMQHALQGWCPTVPEFRRIGVRTAKEINREKYALKAMRGDFDSAGPAPEPLDVLLFLRPTPRLDVARSRHSGGNAKPRQKPPHQDNVSRREQHGGQPLRHHLDSLPDDGDNVVLNFPRHLVHTGTAEGAHHGRRQDGSDFVSSR